MSPDRVNVVSLVREVDPALRVFRDPVDFLEHLEAMDPRSDRFRTLNCWFTDHGYVTPHHAEITCTQL